MNSTSSLTSGRLLARNTLLNIGGETVPFLVAIVAIPILVHAVGVDGYGVLTLVMLAAGYLGVFSFGLDRAATKFIAEAAASGEHGDIPGLFWSSLWMMFGFGLCGAVIVAGLSPSLITDVLRVAPAMRGESLHAFYLMALSLPFVISGGSLGGALSAFQRFDLINALRVPTGVLYYVAPLMVLPFSHSLGWIVGAIVTVRIGSWATSLALCLYVLPDLRREIGLRRVMIRPLVGFGRWVAISGMIAPLLEYADRFVIGSMLSVAAVAYYTIPYQVTGKVRSVPAALSGVVFPAFSASFVRDKPRAALLFGRATRYLLLSLFPPVLLMMALAPEVLRLWVGPSFASHGTVVMRWLALGALFNSLAWVPSALIQGAERPDLVTKLRITEIPFFFAALWWMLSRYGVVGAAITWTVRSMIEASILFLVAGRLLPEAGFSIAQLSRTICLMMPVLAAACLPMDLTVKAVFLVVTLSASVVLSWSRLLDREEKQILGDYLRNYKHVLVGAPD